MTTSGLASPQQEAEPRVERDTQVGNDRTRSNQSQRVVTVAGVSKTYTTGTYALDNVSLNVDEGEFVSLVGPSGCGKSTLLRIIAGLGPVTGGTCETITGPGRAFVFQDPTLLPWRTVQANAELLLELEHVERDERRRRANEALELVGLDEFKSARPRALSGGMKMRLSLARALALQPRLFLFDEPFASVDEITRELLNRELLSIWQRRAFTAIFVTHNLYEAVYLSQRVIVMSARPGRIVADVTVPFPYPRDPAIRTSAEFNSVAEQVATSLRAGSEAQ